MRPYVNRTESRPLDSASLAADIVSAVADRTGADPLDLPALHDTLDVDALADYLEYDHDGGDIVVPYAGYCVTVTPSGVVTAVPLSAITSPAALAAALADSTVPDPACGWQWEPFSGYYGAQYDRGTGERTLVCGEHGDGAWIESDEAVPVET
jgi:hypothetical protein